MNQYYETIMQLDSADEFKSIIRKWNTLSENITKYPTDVPILLPDMLWISKSGLGKTKLLRLMSEYLSTQGNLMEFYGDVKFFEFVLSYCAPDEEFTELQRLMNEVSDAAGFRSEYKGIIRIDINEWVSHYKEKHFVNFIEYLACYSEKWLIILTVDSADSKDFHDFEAFLSMYLRLEKITLTLPCTDDLLCYMERKLGEYGLSVDGSAKELLSATVEKLKENKYFDGYKTLGLLCQDIVYEVFSKERPERDVLTAAMLSNFSCDSDYVKRTIRKIEKVNKIGF